MSKEISVNVKWPWLIIGVATAMIGHKIHGSIFGQLAISSFRRLHGPSGSFAVK